MVQMSLVRAGTEQPERKNVLREFPGMEWMVRTQQEQH